jgi:HD-GYP domain-containing protein (c-di-GMP phosphodiesterase class II)
MSSDVSVALREDKATLEISSHYESFLNNATAIRDRVKNNQDITEAAVVDDLRYAIKEDLADRLYECAMSSNSGHMEIPIHTVKVTFVALKIGKGLGYDAKRLLELGLVAFLENVGMYKIPDRILSKEGKLEPDEMGIIKKHPEMGAKILSCLGERYRWLAKIVLQTHERADGSGYPRGLKGGEISELASIAGLADTYVALTSDRPYRERYLQFNAVKLIITKAKALFPTKILRVFLNEISMFPVGTYVKLNNGCVGRVLSTEKNQVLRPNVKVLYTVVETK